MRFFVFFWVAVELLQVAAIAALALGYRNMRRRLERHDRFEGNPPRSVTED
ncbi:MAG TPA: hypothetical protein VN228_22115 [Pyrinomonadaceae bacterium]|nr:hypothetical protein [Pyrinomonadaceae bacterium]